MNDAGTVAGDDARHPIQKHLPMHHRPNPFVAALALVLAWPAAQAATYVWTSGTFVSGSTAPNPLDAADVLTITGSASKSFSALSFTNLGRVDLIGGGLSLIDGASVTNAGLWDTQGDLNVVQGSGATGTFTNTGTLRKSAGTGTARLGNGATSAIAFVNSGTLDVQAGTVLLNGANRFDHGSVFTGAGVLSVASNSTFVGAMQSQNLQLNASSAVLMTGDQARLSGQAQWLGSTLAGTWTVASGATLLGNGNSATGNKGVSGQLTVDGSLVLDQATGVGVREGGTVLNRGVVELRSNVGFAQGGGAQGSLVNEGTLVKSGGTGTSSVGGGAAGVMAFTNRGTIDVQTGTVQLLGQNRFEDGSQYTGAGTLRVSSASAFAGRQQSQNLLVAASASTAMTGEDVHLGGVVQWSGGRLQGQWTFGPGSTLQAIGGGATGNKVIGGAGTVVTNEGLLTLNSDTGISVSEGAAIVNRGTIDLQDNRGIAHGGGAAVSLVNEGLLVKTGGTGTSTVGGANASFSLVNTGRIEVQTGTLRVTHNLVNDGTLAGTATLQSSGVLQQRGTVAPGTDGIGTLVVSGVTLQMDAGSVFAVDLGAGGTHDLLGVTGSALLGGTLALSCLGDCSYAAGDLITVLDATSSIAGTFAGLSMTGFGSGAFEIVYDTGAAAVQLRVLEAVSPVPEPGNWAMLLAGGAMLAGLWRRRLEG